MHTLRRSEGIDYATYWAQRIQPHHHPLIGRNFDPAPSTVEVTPLPAIGLASTSFAEEISWDLDTLQRQTSLSSFGHITPHDTEYRIDLSQHRICGICFDEIAVTQDPARRLVYLAGLERERVEALHRASFDAITAAMDPHFSHAQESPFRALFPRLWNVLYSSQRSSSPTTPTQALNRQRARYRTALQGLGITLSCPGDHTYCFNCINTHICARLDDADRMFERNAGEARVRVDPNLFPLQCPECILGDRREEWELSDQEADTILATEDAVRWHHHKLLATIPHFRCPHPKCTALIQVEGPTIMGNCPVCHAAICRACQTLVHSGLSCEQRQFLASRSTAEDDAEVLALGREQGWQRCPSCTTMVEHIAGCRHMRCMCGWQFCYRCGANWDTVNRRCGASPPCRLFA